MKRGYALCPFPVVSIKGESSHRSELISQLLYGETVEVLDAFKEWVFVKTVFENYEGWILESQLHHFDGFEEKDQLNFSANQKIKTFDGREICIPLGSNLAYANKLNHRFEPTSARLGFDQIISHYMDSPYLWGGRTVWGIDCSGLTQMLYKLLNKPLPRDSALQEQRGESVSSLMKAKKGDLAFFGEPKITHVGILLDSQTIVHAHGKVRKDTIDQTGILINKSYSHKLKSIKRIL